MPVRRKKLVVASVLLSLLGPVLLVLLVPRLRGSLYAVILARRLQSTDKAVRERARKKLVESGGPAIDGVLPELAASAIADAPGLVFVGQISSSDEENVIYDTFEYLPD